MERLNHILNHTKYKEYLRKNQAAEEGRIFCCHSMEHFFGCGTNRLYYEFRRIVGD